jgi:hypothetical protein
MPADHRLEAVRTRRRHRADDKAGADACLEPLRRCGGHRRRGFSRCQNPQVGRRFSGDRRGTGTAKALLYAVTCNVGERAVDERVRRGRTNAGPDDRQEVVSKRRG